MGECTQSIVCVGVVQTFAWSKQRLQELIEELNCSMKLEQTEELHAFMSDYYEAFYIEEQEQGETDLVEMTEIQYWDAASRRVTLRRMLFTV